MAPAPESAPESVAVKFDIKAKMENAQNAQNAQNGNIEAKKEEPRESKIQNQSTGTLPEKPVRLYVNREDHHLGHLEVYSYDHVGLLFKICELLTSHGVDICSASINTENGVVYNQFEVRIARPSDTAACVECRELEELLEKTRGSAFDNSLANVSKRLSVNPDLVSVALLQFQTWPPDQTVVSFVERPPQRDELCYKLVLEGINQAGLLTYTALVLYRCGFSIATATISTTEGHIVDTFELTTTSAESESLLRSYLDVPMPTSAGQEKTKEVMPLPFHAVESDADLQAWGCRMVELWAAAPSMPSLETTLKPLLPSGRSLSFPIKPEKEAEGLVVVATDDAMRKNLDETLSLLDVCECLFTFAGTAKEMYLVTERPSTKAARELRRSLAVAGIPVMTFGSKSQQRYFKSTLTMQLFELEMPDPFRPKEMIKITAPMPKDRSGSLKSWLVLVVDPRTKTYDLCQEWLALHPLPEFEGWTEDAESADADVANARRERE
eukprot:s3490_g11.t2